MSCGQVFAGRGPRPGLDGPNLVLIVLILATTETGVQPTKSVTRQTEFTPVARGCANDQTPFTQPVAKV